VDFINQHTRISIVSLMNLKLVLSQSSLYKVTVTLI